MNYSTSVSARHIAAPSPSTPMGFAALVLLFILYLLLSPLSASAYNDITGEAGDPLKDIDLTNFSNVKPLLYDWDGDGDLDLFLAGTNDVVTSAQIRYFENTGSGFVEIVGSGNPMNDWNFLAETSGYIQASLAIGDLDGDGNEDVFIGRMNVSGNSNVEHYERDPINGDGIGDTEIATYPGTHTGMATGVMPYPSLSDPDGDGDLDLTVTSDVDGQSFKIRVYQNLTAQGAPGIMVTSSTGGAFFTLSHIEIMAFGGVPVSNASFVEMVDMDNDGNIEAVIGNPDSGSGLVLSHYEWDGSSWTASTLLDGMGYVANFTHGDLTTAMDDDIVMGTSSGLRTFSTLALPVEMTHFSATPSGKANRLNWGTASELNNAGFEVQKSADGREFRRIGFVSGHGTTAEAQEYTFMDHEGGSAYYRLKQTDFDGAFEYSDLVLVQADKQVEIRFYPNPVKDVLSIENAEGQFTLFDASGRPLHQAALSGTKSEIQMGHLPQGLYVLLIEQSNGNILSQRVMR